MKEHIIDCAGLTDTAAFHRRIARDLDFPDWYGHNLDALYDFLTSLPEDTRLILTGTASLGSFADKLAGTLEDAVQENPRLEVILTL